MAKIQQKISNKAIILDGHALADRLLLTLKRDILETSITPGLAAILVGDNPASEIYVGLKEKAAEKIGVCFSKYLSNSQIYQEIDGYELAELIKFLNQDPEIDGIILQLPLPEGFETNKIVKLIDPKKDVDGFNGGKIIPPTVSAIIELLKATTEKLAGKKTLVIGKSDIFSHGLEKYLKSELKIKAVSIEHAIPENSADYDIVIIALGQAKILKKSAIKPGAIVIDVGINKANGKTVGDVDPEVAEVAGYLSPVPGGVGPLTVACLLKNTFELAQKNR